MHCAGRASSSRGSCCAQGCHDGRPAWTQLHRRWLAGLKFEQAVHHLVLEDFIRAIEVGQTRRDRLTAQIEAMLPDWTLAPVVAALQTMRAWRWSMRRRRISRELLLRRTGSQSRSATSPGRDECGCARAIAGSSGPASRPMSSPRQSRANWRASCGPSPGRYRRRRNELRRDKQDERTHPDRRATPGRQIIVRPTWPQLTRLTAPSPHELAGRGKASE
jgi:hypothetical protein